MKRAILHTRVILAATIVCILALAGGCSAANSEGFAIYLTERDIIPTQMPALDHIDLAKQPIIGEKGIISYNAQTHELKLTQSAFENISRLQVPVRGTSFVACVNGKPVYWGAFWTPISSISFDGVTIWKPFSPAEPHIVTLELGYPSSSFYGGEDPRNNPEIIRSLDQAGKLIAKLSIETVSKLPPSMKGYELYSWLEGGQWRFTLITGTDRNKTPDEIISGQDFISEAGWVQIQVAGVEALGTVLGRIPEGEDIFWASGLREPTGQNNIELQLPPGPIIETIRQYSLRRGLNLVVSGP